VVDDYHGTLVPDPYRWLEDATDPETVRFVEEQNRLTALCLGGTLRDDLVRRLSWHFDYPRLFVPERRGGRYFYLRNTGLQNQDVLFVREGLGGPERVLLDPNALSEDGTVALTSAASSRDGRLLAHTLSRSGSDRQEIRVRDVDTGLDLPDRLLWAKFTSLAWTHDGRGFYYLRFPEPGTVPAGEENYSPRLHYHRLGQPQELDALVHERPDDPRLVFAARLTHDDRWLVITDYAGASERSEIRLLDRREAGAHPRLLPATLGLLHSWTFVGDATGRLFFLTDHEAPLGRIVAFTEGEWDRPPSEVLREGPHRLSRALVAGGRMVTVTMVHATDRVAIHGLDGVREGELPLPGLGSVGALTGEPDQREMFLGFASFTEPDTPLRYDFDTRALAPFETRPAAAASVEVRQVFCTSRDGTRVPLFLVHRKDLPRDGARPTLLYGYGGFDISLTPAFNPARRPWLEEGGILAVANLRGGGEYGEAWHQAGMRERKQNVFDDFLAAAEWLLASGYTRRERLAIQGGSNGGLLVAAAMVQRPELFGAVVCQVPVADMLRYHRFTVGRYWIPEYGCADEAHDFPFLFRYSPLHNVEDGGRYPAVLIATADTDDRVDPGMARKLAARLQAAADPQRPVLLRVETKAGHGMGKPLAKTIEEWADIYSFLAQALAQDEDPRGSPDGPVRPVRARA
jgi:prolyl oligopeptidase